MTDYYVGSDHELWTLMIEEEEKLFLESFDKALRSDHLAGPGGSDLKRKIDEAIADGRLPQEFRGEAGSHLRKAMIRIWSNRANACILARRPTTAGSGRSPRFARRAITRS